MAPSKSRLDMVDALVQLSFVVQGVLTDVGGQYDLSLAQTRLLGVLRDRRPGMQQLAGLLGLDKSSTTGLVDRAERRGLVRRAAGAQDGRVVTVTLTAQGRRLVSRAEAAVRERLADLATPLTRMQQHELAALVSRLLVPRG